MSNCREEMRLQSHRRVNTQIKQETEGKPTAVSLPARFSLLPSELLCGGVGNHRLRRSTSSGAPRVPKGTMCQRWRQWVLIFCIQSSPAQPWQPGQGVEGIREGSTNLQRSQNSPSGSLTCLSCKTQKAQHYDPQQQNLRCPEGCLKRF